MSRQITYAAAINEAIDSCLKEDPAVFIMGEGVPDPKGIFGTTSGLKEKYGPSRVMDMPVAENGMTGVCIGAALRGMRPILTHQRVDFALLSLDQIINNAAKWHFMFGGQACVPLVIRMIIGRGWGQGAQHSQSLQALFAHIPGLKVMMPTTPYDAKGMMIGAIRDNNPVISLEHRWLYGLKDHVPAESYTIPLGKGRLVREGNDITIVSSSHMTVEALRAVQILTKKGIHGDLIDLRTIKPLDEELIFASVQKTGRLLVVDTGWTMAGMAAEIIARVTEKMFSVLKTAPVRIALPDIPTPSTPALTKDFYPDYRRIIERVWQMLEKSPLERQSWFNELPDDKHPHDVPDPTFTGPF